MQPKTAYIVPLNRRGEKAKIVRINGVKYEGSRRYYATVEKAIQHAKEICNGRIYITGTWFIEQESSDE